MAWQTPKQNWKAADVPVAEDFNRIEGNIKELEDVKVNKSEAIIKTGGSFTGIISGAANTSYTTAQFRNIILSTSDPSGGANGDIWLKYEP